MYTVAMKIVAMHTAVMHTAVMHTAAMHATAIANFAIQVVVIPAWQIGSPGVKAAGSVLPLTWTGPAAPAAPAGCALEDRPAPAPSVVTAEVEPLSEAGRQDPNPGRGIDRNIGCEDTC